MNQSSFLVVAVFVGIGCSKTPTIAPKSTPAVTATVPQVVQPVEQPLAEAKPEPSKEDRKISILKEKIAGYLSEARAGAKLLTLDPSLGQLKETAKLITELYTHLPDVPAHLDPKGHVATRLKQINETFATIITVYRARIQAEQLNGEVDKINELAEQAVKQASNNLRQFANEIESDLGL